jgi:methyl-accepting chemotaxis protein
MPGRLHRNRQLEGKNFVASEAKSLASQTGQATTRIAAMQRGVAQAVASIGGIRTIIGKVSEIASSIAAAVEQQGAATAEIVRSIETTGRGADQAARFHCVITFGCRLYLAAISATAASSFNASSATLVLNAAP